jgi:hypothetical protein
MGRRKAQARATGNRVPTSFEGMLDGALDKALSIQRPAVRAYLERVRAKQPDATPAQVVALLEKRYRTAVVGLGGASGAAAALPGTGTVASVVTIGAGITGFLTPTAMYVLALAELHDVPVSDPEVRRALLLAVLVGESGAAALELGEAEGRHWAQTLARSMAKDRVTTVNSQLARMLLRRFGARQGALLLGRALPLGIGAGVGAAGNAALARTAIMAARRAFGPPPKTFPARVIDA